MDPRNPLMLFAAVCTAIVEIVFCRSRIGVFCLILTATGIYPFAQFFLPFLGLPDLGEFVYYIFLSVFFPFGFMGLIVVFIDKTREIYSDIKYR